MSSKVSDDLAPGRNLRSLHGVTIGLPCWLSGKESSPVQETQVRALDQEGLLKKEMATHSSIIAWKNPMNRGASWATVHGVAKSQT